MNLLDKLIYHCSQPRLRLLHSLFFNFKLLPIKQAIKLPIYIYGPIKFYWLCGKIELRSEKIFSGMIKLGRNNEFFNGTDKSSFILMEKNSKIIFEGPCAIGNNYKIRVTQNAELIFGAYTFFGSSIKFICSNKIKIVAYTRCAYESQFVDSNFHFVLNMKTGNVTRRESEILIGKCNWIGNRTSITKGSKTKDFSIICAGSLMNKDYTQNEENFIMLGGSPAKVLTSGLKRIFSTEIEKDIIYFFNNNPKANNYNLTSELSDDFKDIHYWFEHMM